MPRRQAYAAATTAANKSGPSIEASSTTSTSAACHASRASTDRRARAASSPGDPFAAPTPAKLCRVYPPTRHAADAVVAVTATVSPRSSRSSRTACRSTWDLPVPAAPHTKMLWRWTHIKSSASLCSLDSPLRRLYLLAASIRPRSSIRADAMAFLSDPGEGGRALSYTAPIRWARRKPARVGTTTLCSLGATGALPCDAFWA